MSVNLSGIVTLENISYCPLSRITINNTYKPGQWVYYNYTEAGSYTLNLSFTKQTTVFFFAVGTGGNGENGFDTLSGNFDPNGRRNSYGAYGGSVKNYTYQGKIFKISLSLGPTQLTNSTSIFINYDTSKNVIKSDNGYIDNISSSISKLITNKFYDGNSNKVIKIGGGGGEGGDGTYDGGYSNEHQGEDATGGGGGSGGGKPHKDGGKGQNGFNGGDNHGGKYLNGGDGGNGFNFSQGGVGGGAGGGGGRGGWTIPVLNKSDYGDNGKGGIGGLGAVMIYYQVN